MADRIDTTIVPPSASVVTHVAEELDQHTQVATLTADLLRAHETRLATEARLTQLDRAIEYTHRTFDAFDAALAKIYRNPDEARATFVYLAETRGVEYAAATLRDTPGKLADPMPLVAVREPAGSGASGGTTTEVAPYSWRALDAREAARRLRDTALAASIEGRLAYNAQEAADMLAYTTHAKRLDTVFRHTLDRLYIDPVEAHRHFLDYAGDHGADTAAQHLRSTPEVYGALRTAMPDVATTGWQHPEVRRLAYLAADAGLARADYELREGVELPYTQQLQAALDRAMRTERRFDRALAEFYLDPVRARTVFRREAAQLSVHAAATALYVEPTKFGPLRAEYIRDTQSNAQVDTHTAAEQSVTMTRDQARRLATRGRADHTAQEMFRTALWRDDQRAVTYAIRDALYETFDNPAEAWRRLTRVIAERGVAEAVTRLQETPTWFGTLRNREAGHPDPLVAVQEVANHAGRLASTSPPIAEVRGTAWQQMVQARAHEGQIRTQLAALPAKEVLERSIAVGIHHMTSAQRAQLQQVVTPPQFVLAQQLAARIHELVLGTSHER